MYSSYSVIQSLRASQSALKAFFLTFSSIGLSVSNLNCFIKYCFVPGTNPSGTVATPVADETEHILDTQHKANAISIYSKYVFFLDTCSCGIGCVCGCVCVCGCGIGFGCGFGCGFCFSNLSLQVCYSSSQRRNFLCI